MLSKLACGFRRAVSVHGVWTLMSMTVVLWWRLLCVYAGMEVFGCCGVSDKGLVAT